MKLKDALSAKFAIESTIKESWDLNLPYYLRISVKTEFHIRNRRSNLQTAT